jgi:hypothetical protein
MHLRGRSFRCGGVEAVNAPLDAAIGRLLAPYHSGGRQGDTKQYKDVICTHFDGCFDGHRDVVVLYRAHRPMEEVQGFHKSH